MRKGFSAKVPEKELDSSRKSAYIRSPVERE